MAVVSICLALVRIHLELGLLISFLTIPALIRTGLVATREGQTGRQLTPMSKVWEFLFSWALMVPIGFAALMAGGAAFTAVAMVGFIVSGLVGSTDQVTLVLEFYFFVGCCVAALIAIGSVFVLCIRSSLAYRPVIDI